MDFIPDTPKTTPHSIPFFENATKEDGWQGQATTKSIERLKAEVIDTLERLGGNTRGFQRGKFDNRDGFRLHYLIETSDGRMIPGRIDIAALPVKDDWRTRATLEKRREQSLRMALYMLRIALDGTWFLQQLSPGYSALMPWMLASGDKTISQLWGESSVMQNLLPPGDGEFVEAEYKQV